MSVNTASGFNNEIRFTRQPNATADSMRFGNQTQQQNPVHPAAECDSKFNAIRQSNLAMNSGAFIRPKHDIEFKSAQLKPELQIAIPKALQFDLSQMLQTDFTKKLQNGIPKALQNDFAKTEQTGLKNECF